MRAALTLPAALRRIAHGQPHLLERLQAYHLRTVANRMRGARQRPSRIWDGPGLARADLRPDGRAAARRRRQGIGRAA